MISFTLTKCPFGPTVNIEYGAMTTLLSAVTTLVRGLLFGSRHRLPLARDGGRKSGAASATATLVSDTTGRPRGGRTPRVSTALAMPFRLVTPAACRGAALASARVGEGIKRLTGEQSATGIGGPGPYRSWTGARARRVPLHREMRAVTEPASSSTVARGVGGSATGGNA